MTSVTAFGSNAANDVRCCQVELEHRLDRCVERAVGRDAVPLRLKNDPRAEALRQEEHVAGQRARLRPDPLRMNHADDGEAVLRLGVADRMAAREDRARLAHLLVGAREHLAEHLDRKLLGERGDGEGEQGPAAHREHVVQRIRRRDRAERARIVDERREEVDREDDRALVVEAVDRRIVGRIEADEEILGIGRSEPGEERLEPARRVLRRASARLGERRESDGLHVEALYAEGIRAGAKNTGGRRDPSPSPLPLTQRPPPPRRPHYLAGGNDVSPACPLPLRAHPGPPLACGRMNRPSALDAVRLNQPSCA